MLLPRSRPGSGVPICTRLVTICKVRSIPTSVGRMKRSAVGRGGRFLQVPSLQHRGGRRGERAGGRRPAAPDGAAHNPAAANGAIRRTLQREENIARARGAVCGMETGRRFIYRAPQAVAQVSNLKR